MPQLDIYLLGVPRVEYDGAIIELNRRKAMALLAYLAVTGKRCSRDTLAALLWPDYDDKSARAGLRRALAVINQTPITGWIEADHNTITLIEREGLWIDIQHFHDVLDLESEPGRLAEAVDLYRDDFMSGFSLRDSRTFDEWQAVQVQLLRHRMVATIEKLVEYQIRQQDLERAIQSVQRWLVFEPLHEPALHYLMRLYAASGQRAAALRQYESFVALLERELGVFPQQETVELYEAIRNNRAISLEGRAVPVFGNLPALPDMVVGREDALTELKRRLARQDSEAQQSVVMQGWPGIGKTTITSVLAHDAEMQQQYVDGVLWTSLGQTPNLLAELINWANALGYGEFTSQNTIEEVSTRLTALLRDKHMLLIVDDIWDAGHIVPFRVGGRGSALLITTRMNDVARALAASPDHIYKLPILDEAVSLELLRKLAPEAVSQNRGDALGLVRDLEGLPLALQVAGRLLRAEMSMGWGVADLLAELRAGVRLLEAQAPVDRVDLALDTTPTVAALLQRSTDLLDEPVRERFALLGVFAPKPATFDLEAMKDVWTMDDPRPTVRQLVDRGLLEPIGAGRFQMHALLVMHARSMFKG